MLVRYGFVASGRRSEEEMRKEILVSIDFYDENGAA
jgi:hypothetical protein